MKMVINGGGKVGSFLAMAMVKNGHLVTLIERRLEVSQKVALEVPEALIILGDGCDVRYQEDAGVDNADVFVTVTGDDDDNLVACQIAQGVFSVQRAIARVNNPKNEAIFRALGIEAVSSTTIIARLIEEEISIGNVVTLQALKKGKMALVEIELPKAGGAGAGVQIQDLELPQDCVLVSIVRDDDIIIPRGETLLEGGDTVVVLTKVANEKALTRSLVGK
ncbi:MAG TPA: TrkA family potassium uptake protein [Actinobacteria bacterium]|nr:TrkA family potassium uptake protein [Actinomycetota bacterium]